MCSKLCILALCCLILVYAIKKTFGSLFGNWLCNLGERKLKCCYEKRRNMMEYLLMNRLYYVSFMFYFLSVYSRSPLISHRHTSGFVFFPFASLCVSVSSRTIMINCLKTKLYLIYFFPRSCWNCSKRPLTN